MKMKQSGVALAVLVWMAIASAEAKNVVLVWDANTESDLAGYNIYRSATSGGGYSRLNSSLVPVSSSPEFTDANIPCGARFHYVATAVNTAGLESDYSNEVSIQVPCPPGSLRIRPAVTASAGRNGDVVIQWEPVPGALEYALHQRLANTITAWQYLARTPDTRWTGRLSRNAEAVGVSPIGRDGFGPMESLRLQLR
jgi:fibronectin type 3 domain-containing protein